MTPDYYGYHPCPTCGVLAPVDRPHPATFCDRNRVAWLARDWESTDGNRCVSYGWVDRAFWSDIPDEHFDLTRYYDPMPPPGWRGTLHVHGPVPMQVLEAAFKALQPEPTGHVVTVDVEALWGGT